MPKETFLNLKEEKQERILRAAISEFQKSGFKGAGVGTIAKNADVAKGSIYQYFEDKNELFSYCVKWSVLYLVKKLGVKLNIENLDIFEYFSGDIKLRLKFVREEKELAFFAQDVFLGKFRTMPQDYLSEMVRIADDYLLNLITTGQERGSVRSDLDPELLKLFISGAGVRVKEEILKDTEKSGFDIADDRMEKYEKIVMEMTDVLRNGIGVRTAGQI